MASIAKPLTTIKLRGHRKRKFANTLLKWHSTNAEKSKSSPPQSPIRVVCISDTHSKRPKLPDGDILIHAGDLTENGSFDEVQAELNWLSSQPHRYKILIAGNHDVLLDEEFLDKYPERRYGQIKSKKDLNWGSVLYLQDTCVTVDFPKPEGSILQPPRKLTLFGSPWTPRYGISAFQYNPSHENYWKSRFEDVKQSPDIVITHGPPKHHLDARDFHRAGCPYLAEQIAKLRPPLVVFGHIHASYGCEDTVLDGVQREYEKVMTGWGGWRAVAWMVVLIMWGRLQWCFGVKRRKSTIFVNASVVGGPRNELKNQPIVVDL